MHAHAEMCRLVRHLMPRHSARSCALPYLHACAAAHICCCGKPPILTHLPPLLWSPPLPAVDEAGLSGRQRTAWHELQARWSWLDGLSEADQSWIGFGLFHAYQQAG